MRAAVAAVAVVGLVALRETTPAFLLAPWTGSASPSASLASSLRAGLARGAATSPSPSAGVWCVCGCAALVAATAAGRRSSAKLRGSVAVKVGKAADLVAQRLQQAFKMSADLKKSMTELEARNHAMLEQLDAASLRVQVLEVERDQLKGQLNGLAEKLDSSIMGPLQNSAAIATHLSAMKAGAVEAGAVEKQMKAGAVETQFAESEEMQRLEAERDELQAEINALVAQIDSAYNEVLQSSAATAEQLAVLKGAAVEPTAPAPAAATPAALTSAGARAKPGAMKGKLFFPLWRVMRAVVVALAVVGLVALRATSPAFLVAPGIGSALPSASRASSLRAGLAGGAATSPSSGAGVWCVCGCAAVVAATAAGRRSSAKLRGCVSVKIGKAANLVAVRLEQAFKISADLQESMTELEARNASMLEQLDAASLRVQVLEVERDQLKGQLSGLAEKLDSSIMGPLQNSAAMATHLSAMKAGAAETQFAESEKVQRLEAERDELQAQLCALVEQMDSALIAPLQISAATAEKLSVLKGAAGEPMAPAPAAATLAAPAFAGARAKRGAMKGKLFFPLPYPDHSIGDFYMY